MVQYLSMEWLARLPRAEVIEPPGEETGPQPSLRHVVLDAPGGGQAHYDVRITPEGPVLAQSNGCRADITFTSDYRTAAAIASGTLSTQAALAAGRLKVRGDVGALARIASVVGGREALPSSLRDETGFVP